MTIPCAKYYIKRKMHKKLDFSKTKAIMGVNEGHESGNANPMFLFYLFSP